MTHLALPLDLTVLAACGPTVIVIKNAEDHISHNTDMDKR
jgi:hypothetical protein